MKTPQFSLNHHASKGRCHFTAMTLALLVAVTGIASTSVSNAQTRTAKSTETENGAQTYEVAVVKGASRQTSKSTGKVPAKATAKPAAEVSTQQTREVTTVAAREVTAEAKPDVASTVTVASPVVPSANAAPEQATTTTAVVSKEVAADSTAKLSIDPAVEPATDPKGDPATAKEVDGGPPPSCTVCHKRRQNLTLPCNGLTLQRHMDHGDTTGPCPSQPGAGE